MCLRRPLYLLILRSLLSYLDFKFRCLISPSYFALFILSCYFLFHLVIRNGVENMLMHYIPEVKGIEEVGQIGADDEESKLLFKSTA